MALNRLHLLMLAFFASGFAGLIYESIWTRYLKLFLGHAALAQTAVLALFLGGMAVGAALAGRYTRRLNSPLAAYALAEGIVALAALGFHAYFNAITGWLYADVFPAVADPTTVQILKWSVASLSILPQSILLGATFPLMTAGILRLQPNGSGATIATLYLLNSLGAAIGVLVSAFLLVPAVGLPGALLTAGLINSAVALLVWRLRGEPSPHVDEEETADVLATPLPRLLLAAAAVTGAASFFYEIAWIRMLSMVLGASTDAFDLMLSAFILGLALGGGWIRKRIDRLQRPMVFLGLVQLAMGVLALATLWLYNASFGWMEAAMDALALSENGYRVFSLASHGIAMAIMVPVTFCAGMTLPLLTELLLRAAYGERAIGQVYAANTLGSIAGVLLAVHLVMPLGGVHGVMVLGGLADMVLGVVLLVAGAVGLRRIVAAGIATLAASGSAAVWGAPDPYRMSSGVFRTRVDRLPAGLKVLFARDGKTATVSLVGSPDGTVSLLTNGKTDASINVTRKPDDKDNVAVDEHTQVLLGALPLILAPATRTAAVIGLGSGTTSHVLLASPKVEHVDTIEIEPVMAEAARQGFGPLVRRTFEDPRSRLIFDDAKSFLSSAGSRYDLIVSEPSNPWVSGVASLFSGEFYALAARHLEDDGLFVQWLQGYETNLSIFSSVILALRETFPDYAIYTAADKDLIIVANKRGGGLRLAADTRLEPYMAQELSRTFLDSMSVLQLRLIGGTHLFDPLVRTLPTVANSDYFPWVDNHAPKSRFMREHIGGIAGLGLSRVPLLEMLGGQPVPQGLLQKDAPELTRAALAYQAGAILKGMKTGDWQGVDPVWQRQVAFLLSGESCAAMEGAQVKTLIELAGRTIPYLASTELAAMWAVLDRGPCWRKPGTEMRQWRELAGALGDRSGARAAALAEDLLNGRAWVTQNRELGEYALLAALVGHLSLGQKERAQAVWQRHAKVILKGGGETTEWQLLRALTFGQA